MVVKSLFKKLTDQEIIVYQSFQFLIKQDGKYFLYINNQFSNQIKDIKIVQQESIRQEKINRASPKNEDEEVYFYFLISVVFLLFILFGSKKL